MSTIPWSTYSSSMIAAQAARVRRRLRGDHFRSREADRTGIASTELKSGSSRGVGATTLTVEEAGEL